MKSKPVMTLDRVLSRMGLAVALVEKVVDAVAMLAVVGPVALLLPDLPRAVSTSLAVLGAGGLLALRRGHRAAGVTRGGHRDAPGGRAPGAAHPQPRHRGAVDAGAAGRLRGGGAGGPRAPRRAPRAGARLRAPLPPDAGGAGDPA